MINPPPPSAIHWPAPHFRNPTEILLGSTIVCPFRLARAFFPGRTPASLGLNYDRLAVNVEPGITLRGWFVHSAIEGRPPLGTVIILHGISACKEAMLSHARHLAEWGYQCILYDSRAHGESGGRYCTYGYYERWDVSRVLDAAQERFGPLGPIAILGTSFGGAVAIQAMEIDPRIECGIVESTFAALPEVVAAYQRRFTGMGSPAITALALAGAERLAHFPVMSIRPEESARHLRQPVLVMHGTADANISIENGRRIFRALSSPGSRWYEVAGAGHYSLDVGDPGYEREQRSFLEKNCHFARGQADPFEISRIVVPAGTMVSKN